MKKKAQGLSMNVIIIAALALIVLIVLVVIFTGRAKIFSKTTSDQTSKFTGNNCEIPGTNNECFSNADTCSERGGAYTEKDYADCVSDSGCCLL